MSRLHFLSHQRGHPPRLPPSPHRTVCVFVGSPRCRRVMGIQVSPGARRRMTDAAISAESGAPVEHGPPYSQATVAGLDIPQYDWIQPACKEGETLLDLLKRLGLVDLYPGLCVGTSHVEELPVAFFPMAHCLHHAPGWWHWGTQRMAVFKDGQWTQQEHAIATALGLPVPDSSRSWFRKEEFVPDALLFYALLAPSPKLSPNLPMVLRIPRDPCTPDMVVKTRIIRIADAERDEVNGVYVDTGDRADGRRTWAQVTLSDTYECVIAVNMRDRQCSWEIRCFQDEAENRRPVLYRQWHAPSWGERTEIQIKQAALDTWVPSTTEEWFHSESGKKSRLTLCFLESLPSLQPADGRISDSAVATAVAAGGVADETMLATTFADTLPGISPTNHAMPFLEMKPQAGPSACMLHLLVCRLRQQLPHAAVRYLHDVATSLTALEATVRIVANYDEGVKNALMSPSTPPIRSDELSSLVSAFEAQGGCKVPSGLVDMWSVTGGLPHDDSAMQLVNPRHGLKVSVGLEYVQEVDYPYEEDKYYDFTLSKCALFFTAEGGSDNYTRVFGICDESSEHYGRLLSVGEFCTVEHMTPAQFLAKHAHRDFAMD
eukprot:m.80927 g.80927  ORF g.80927 m.80927 type:complete len:602 (+) comp9378_c0_seq2:544-2349(+)